MTKSIPLPGSIEETSPLAFKTTRNAARLAALPALGLARAVPPGTDMMGGYCIELDSAECRALETIIEAGGDASRRELKRMPWQVAYAMRQAYPDSQAVRDLGRLRTRECGVACLNSNQNALLAAFATGARIKIEAWRLAAPEMPERGATGLNVPGAPLARAFLDAIVADRAACAAATHDSFEADSKASLAALAVACGNLDSGFFDWARYDDSDSVAAYKMLEIFETIGRDGTRPIDYTAKPDRATSRRLARLARKLDAHALIQLEVEARWNGVDGKGDVESKAAAQAMRDAWTPEEREAHARGGAPWK